MRFPFERGFDYDKLIISNSSNIFTYITHERVITRKKKQLSGKIIEKLFYNLITNKKTPSLLKGKTKWNLPTLI